MPRTAPEAPWPLIRRRQGLGTQKEARAGAGAAAAGTEKSRGFPKSLQFRGARSAAVDPRGRRVSIGFERLWRCPRPGRRSGRPRDFFVPAAAAPAPARPPIWLPRPCLQRSSGQEASGEVRGMGWGLTSSHFFQKKLSPFSKSS